MNNIFENAYFGKLYKTRDGRKAIYHIFDGQYHRLITGERCDFSPFCDDNGRHLTHTEGDSPFDIVSEWEEEINEEELDKMAKSFSSFTDVNRKDIEWIFKSGYRKALEINKK